MIKRLTVFTIFFNIWVILMSYPVTISRATSDTTGKIKCQYMATYQPDDIFSAWDSGYLNTTGQFIECEFLCWCSSIHLQIIRNVSVDSPLGKCLIFLCSELFCELINPVLIDWISSDSQEESFMFPSCKRINQTWDMKWLYQIIRNTIM